MYIHVCTCTYMHVHVHTCMYMYMYVHVSNWSEAILFIVHCCPISVTYKNNFEVFNSLLF